MQGPFFATATILCTGLLPVKLARALQFARRLSRYLP